MLTREKIEEELLRDPEWEPADDSTQSEWELFDEIYQELQDKGKLKIDLDALDLEDEDADGDSGSWDEDSY